MSGRRAAFLDRDGTIIEDVHYISQADDVRLLPGASDAIRLLNEHGVAVAVITNQSGLARGIVTPAQYEAVSRRVVEVLASDGARIDATYYCPHYPGVTGACECRKPGTLLYDRAIADLGIDASASMFAGDRPRDVVPAAKYSGAAYLIRSDDPAAQGNGSLPAGTVVVGSLLEGVEHYLGIGAFDPR